LQNEEFIVFKARQNPQDETGLIEKRQAAKLATALRKAYITPHLIPSQRHIRSNMDSSGPCQEWENDWSMIYEDHPNARNRGGDRYLLRDEFVAKCELWKTFINDFNERFVHYILAIHPCHATHAIVPIFSAGTEQWQDGPQSRQQGECNFFHQLNIYMMLSSAFHADFPFYAAPDTPTPGVDLGLAFVLALENNTCIHIRRKGQIETITIHAGEIFMFTGDLIHAGASYQQSNMRIHGYFIVANGKRDAILKTHWVDWVDCN
jgi:hypothetical protein